MHVLMFGSWVLNEIWIVDHSFSLGRYVNDFIQIISSFDRSLFKLRCDTLIGIVIVIKHVALFAIRAELTAAFTFTSLPLNFHTSVSGCGCGFGFEQKSWRIDGFGEKRHGSANLHNHYSPPQ